MTRNVPTLPRIRTNRVSRRQASTTARSCHAMGLHGRQIAKCAALPSYPLYLATAICQYFHRSTIEECQRKAKCMKSGNFDGPQPHCELIRVEPGLSGIRVGTARC
ncbi:hypothetical protein COCC4DRAFT_153140 [Bipolaris maydis ATCC 48331]|uniref:Uncharacterized protein n=2 Tax=Cochliobolus heterostrophus TaxID=5016 RepID=M2TFI3_COCH5|nr:uncharacterized protein COCC4DRAFT_153140 [Bipolaris maydis ATCC 48331]EMD85264.1 hypothetical protein COCHEDRAFT_1119621 [Bipolaris maydis C5]ENH99507.1 hypothetical protein COCC4DRAFT_153140 [Bipolaris maydis ATCC 48331]